MEQPFPVRPGETRSPFAVAKHVCGVMKIQAGGPVVFSTRFFTWPSTATAFGSRPAPYTVS